MSSSAPDTLHTNSIQAIATEIKESRRPDKELFYKTKYSQFAETYPTLFKLCCDPQASIEQLSFILRQLEAVRQNKMSEHDASVRVGQRLVDVYVKPMLQRNDSSDGPTGEGSS